MAHKRMFSKNITTSDAFREMPTSTQALYFHLGMEADDDGFLDSYKGLMRAVGAKDDDLKLLIAKRFILPRDNGIIVIKHWLINNTIRKDRYTETKHIEAKNGLFLKQNGAYTEDSNAGIPVGNHLATQKRIGKERKEDITAGADYKIVDEEPEKPRAKDNHTKEYDKLIKWLRDLTGAPLINKPKQYAHLKKAREADISPTRLKNRATELWEKPFYRENGMDWGGVVSSFDKKA